MFTYLTFIVNSLYNNKDPCHTNKSLLFCIIIKTHERIFSGGSLSAVAGVNVMWFKLNSQWLLEPRLSFAYKTSASSTLSAAYALNSRKENTDVYFVETKPGDGSPAMTNKDLGLTRSHHFSVSFAKQIGLHRSPSQRCWRRPQLWHRPHCREISARWLLRHAYRHAFQVRVS